MCFYFIFHIEWPSMHIKSVRNHLLLLWTFFSLTLSHSLSRSSCVFQHLNYFAFDNGRNRWGNHNSPFYSDKFSTFMVSLSMVWGFLWLYATAMNCHWANAWALYGSFNICASDCECVRFVWNHTKWCSIPFRNVSTAMILNFPSQFTIIHVVLSATMDGMASS